MAARGPDQVCANHIRIRAETLVCRTPWAIFQYFRYIRNIFTAAEHRRLSSMMSGSERQRAAVSSPLNYRRKGQNSVAKEALLHSGPASNPFHRCANITAICTKTR
jgi:hypothetical protein